MTELAPGEMAHLWPQILPGGKAVLFRAYSSVTGLDGATVEVLSLRDGRSKVLVRGHLGQVPARRPPGLYQQRYALCDSF
jgi:hypothetical protein